MSTEGEKPMRLSQRRWLKPLLLVVASLMVSWIAIGFIGAIDWAQVLGSLAKLNVANGVVLVLALLLRQGLNAIPLSKFVRGLSWRQSVHNDLGANVVATFAPPPADVALRASMFRSWGINPVDGMAGVTLNMVTFYAVRFLAPAIGVALIAVQGVQRHQVITAVISGVIACVIVGGLIAVMRGEALAAWLGRSAARVAQRLRGDVDELTWSSAVVDFRQRMNETLRAGLPPALGALVAMVACDSLILLMALRFIGVSAEQLTAIDAVAAFFIAYPLTLLPLSGLGVLDVALLAAYTDIAGLKWEAEIVAALVVWRTVTIGGSLAMGAVLVARWRALTFESDHVTARSLDQD